MCSSDLLSVLVVLLLVVGLAVGADVPGKTIGKHKTKMSFIQNFSFSLIFYQARNSNMNCPDAR